MCPKVKRYKRKEMSTLLGPKNEQKVCLQRDTDSEGKVKKVHCNISTLELQPEGLHFGLLVNIILSGVAQPILKAACFGRQRPH
jgi:hypothetical protein